jgi:hypothetical protein
MRRNKMKLYYEKSRYAVDGTLAIMTWTDEDGYFEPYGDVTVNLSGYGMFPQDDGYIFIPTYKMSTDYYKQVCDDIVDEVIQEIPIGYGTGVYARLKENWDNQVVLMDRYRKEAWE